MSGLDRDALRRALYTVSLRHDWANTTDTEDRTEEIAAEYDRLVNPSADDVRAYALDASDPETRRLNWFEWRTHLADREPQP